MLYTTPNHLCPPQAVGGSPTCTLAVLEQSIRTWSPAAADHGLLRLLGDQAVVGSSQGSCRTSACQEPELGRWGVVVSKTYGLTRTGTGRFRKDQWCCQMHRVNTA